MRKQLEFLRDQTRAESLAEVIRRALAVYDILRDAVAEGGQIVLRADGAEQRLMIPEFAHLNSRA